MRVYYTPLKHFVFGVVGVILIAAAVDIVYGHWLSVPPEAQDGFLTTRGEAQRRGDILWGGTMLTVGILIFMGSMVDLLRRHPLLIIDGSGVHLGRGSREGPALIPWADIKTISSDVASDPYDGSERERLVLAVVAGAEVARELSTVTREKDTLYVGAHDWSVPVTDVVLAAQGAHNHFQRMELVRTYEPPSIEWDVSISQPHTPLISDEVTTSPTGGEDETSQASSAEEDT